MMLAQGGYQVESTSKRIKAGLERARAEREKVWVPVGPRGGAAGEMPVDVR